MRVLVVEDEIPLAQAVARGLTAEGFEVDVVHDGADGLWRAREGSYDAIVLDILLPGMNGYKVCETLRDEGVWTPILMLTAKDGEWDEAEALDTGADDFLSKPFSFVVLLARLRALFRRGAPPRPAVPSHGRAVIAGPAGSGRAGFVSRDDCADVAAAVLLDDSGAWDGATPGVTGPTALTLAEAAAVFKASGEKARSVLGWEPRSNEDAIVATAESLRDLGLLKKR